MQQKGQFLCYSKTLDSVLCKLCLLTARNSAFSVHSASCDVAMCVTNSKSRCHLRFDETRFRPVDRTSLDHNRCVFFTFHWRRRSLLVVTGFKSWAHGPIVVQGGPIDRT